MSVMQPEDLWVDPTFNFSNTSSASSGNYSKEYISSSDIVEDLVEIVDEIKNKHGVARELLGSEKFMKNLKDKIILKPLDIKEESPKSELFFDPKDLDI